MHAELEIPEFENSFKILSYEHEGRSSDQPHWHREIEIIYSHSGTLNLGVRDEVLTLEEGEIYVVDSGITHFFLSSPGNMRYVLQFDLREIMIPRAGKSSFSDEDLFNQIQPHSRYWPEQSSQKIANIFLEIMDELRFKEEDYEDLVLAKLLEMKVILNREVPRVLKNQDKFLSKASQHADILNKLNLVYQYCEDHFMEVIRLEDVAGLLGYNEQYFTRFFKKHTGKTFLEHLNHLKVQKASWLLVKDNKPLSEIAFESGFASLKTFHHVFKAEMGIPPGEYRKSFFGNRK